MEISNKAKELLNDYVDKRDVLNMSLSLTNLKQDEFEFSVDFNPTEEIDSIKFIPYENNTTGSYFNVLPLHYANVLIKDTVDQTLLKKVRDGIAKATRVSDYATNVMNILNKELTSQDLELYVDMQKRRDKILELSTSPKLFNNMRLGIELVKGKKWIIKPVIGFQKDTMKTNKDKYTAYAFTRLIKTIKPRDAHTQPYGMFKQSLLMAYEIITLFHSLADGVVDMGILPINDIESSIDEYVTSFINVSTLVNTQTKFDKSKAKEALEMLLMFKDSQTFEKYNLQIERSDEELVDYDREDKGDKVGTVIGGGSVEEKEFKAAVRDQLVRYKFEPVRLMEIGEISREPIWIRETAKELRTELEQLGSVVHPSILMTLGEMSPEDLMKTNTNNNATNSNNAVNASVALSQSNVIDNGNGTFTVDGMVVDQNMAMNMGISQQPQQQVQPQMTLAQMQQMQQMMGVAMAPAVVEPVRDVPLGTIVYV